MSGSAHNAVPTGVRLLDRLRDEGRISALQYESLYHQAQRTGERIEETILQSGALSEQDLMKCVAALYQTRYVSTERLSKAHIDPATLELVPRRVAERLQCVPILYNKQTQTLAVVAYDLEDDIGKQIQVLTGVREVQVLAARPAAVRAAIRRFYAGDVHAFATIPTAQVGHAAAIETFERTSAPAGGTALGSPFAFESSRRALSRSGVPPPRSPPAASATPTVGAPKHDTTIASVGGPDWDAHLETVKVFATLLDASRGELRAHSTHVARLTGQVADRLGVSEDYKRPLLLAALLHDVGKASTYHLTALNVSRFDGHRVQAERTYLAPVRMFESAKLPTTTVEVLTHLYERWDGQGFPARLAGKDIPLGARIVALVETYADLTVNPNNPYRKTLSPAQAVDVVGQLASTLFDPAVAEALHGAIAEQDRSAGRAMSGGRSRVLIVDPDREETLLLELRLAEAGHEVLAVRDRKEAEAALAQHPFALVISEVELGDESGLALLSAMRTNPNTKDIPFVFLTRKADRESVARGFDLGAADYFVKPASAELVVAKTAKLLESTGRGSPSSLSGNLRDMSLADVIQTLANGRKSGLLRITARGQHGEIQFLEGTIADAKFPPREREDALYWMLALQEGSFAFDPAFKPARRVIQESTEALILEGMRRIDEQLI